MRALAHVGGLLPSNPENDSPHVLIRKSTAGGPLRNHPAVDRDTAELLTKEFGTSLCSHSVVTVCHESVALAGRH
jgi:hypothetical protein